MAKTTILYRGPLKSCNYSCSYCPFSKHVFSDKELERDREHWSRFCRSLEERLTEGRWEEGREPGALLVVPYGEALIHPWYWEGLARISRVASIDAAGAQTNLSFSPGNMLPLFDGLGGRREKLRIWATFHPQMISAAGFAEKCLELAGLGIRVSPGAVGVPGHIEQLRQLRHALPEDIYLWINRMDGLQRPYTADEEAAFLKIDPFFAQELKVRSTAPDQCKNRLFVEGDGRLRICNISRLSKANWYDGSSPDLTKCGRPACTCYLAYGGRMDYENRMAFGRYPLFRIPWKPKALFLDIDGTLLPDEKSAPEPGLIRRLEDLSRRYFLFFATSLSCHEAVKRCNGFSGLFSGGVFAGGAHVLDTTGEVKKERFFTLDPALPPLLRNIQRRWESDGRGPRFRLLVYKNQKNVFKLTLSRPACAPWNREDVNCVLEQLPADAFRYFTEGSRLVLVAPQVNKGLGVTTLCAFSGVSPEDAVAVGNAKEDIPMFQVCGFGIAAPESPESVKNAADMIWTHRMGD